MSITYDIVRSGEIVKVKGVERREIAEVIKAFGISPAKKGYRYLCDAVEIVLENPEYLDGGITKILYPAIKNLRGQKSWGAVERSIRHAINDAERFWWENHRHDMSEEVKKIMDNVFPLGGRVHYSNKEFICNIAEYFILLSENKEG